MALGIAQDKSAANSAVSLAENVIFKLKESLSKVPSSLEGLDQFNPVITPVVDLTKVHEASKNISTLMAASALKAAVSFTTASQISSATAPERVTEEPTSTVTPTGVMFEQNIYAPKALSTNDIYRNTKSQIVLAKEELGIS